MNDFYSVPGKLPVQNIPTNTVNTQQTLVQQTNFLQNIDLAQILSTINTFALAWTMVYSLLFICDFMFYRVFHGDREVSREKRGKVSLFAALKVWCSYALCLLVYMIYLSFRSTTFGVGIGVIAVVCYAVKIFLYDFALLPFIGGWVEHVKKAAISVYEEMLKLIRPAPAPSKDAKK
jgi:hypothetical protein